MVRAAAGNGSGQRRDRNNHDEVGASDDGNQSDGVDYSHGQGAGHGYDCSSHHARENRCDEVVANGNDYSARFEGLRPESAVRQWGPRVWEGEG